MVKRGTAIAAFPDVPPEGASVSAQRLGWQFFELRLRVLTSRIAYRSEGDIDNVQKRINVTLAVIGVMATAAILRSGQIPGLQEQPRQSELTSLSALADSVDAYIYGYPLMMIGITERVATTTPGAKPNAGRAPLNQFTKSTVLPDGTYKDVVLPSTLTLYASSFINLSAEPVILHLPVIDRFYLMQMLDAWTNVSTKSPGTRINSQEGDYAFSGA
jgi:hypothetical protein